MNQNTKGNKRRIILNKWNLAETGHWRTVKRGMPFWQVQKEKKWRAGEEEHKQLSLSPLHSCRLPAFYFKPRWFNQLQLLCFPHYSVKLIHSTERSPTTQLP